ncbi:MAG: hypothetical protein AAGA48_15120 [Myxococcota bacterium]
MDELEQQLRNLNAPFSNRHSATEVLAIGRRRKRRRRAWVAASGVIMAGLVVVALGPPVSTERERGGVEAPQVVLRAVAEGPQGLRPLASSSRLGSDEAVVFQIETTEPGTLSLGVDGGAHIWPPVGQTWHVDAGEHYVGTDVPLSWTPDADPTAPKKVVATLCAEDAPTSCATASLVVSWATP